MDPEMPSPRRDFLRAAAAVGAGLLPSPSPARAPEGGGRPVKAVAWDAQQPAQKPAHEEFLRNASAESLQAQPGFWVESARRDAPEQGLSAGVLDGADVLIGWGHARHAEVAPEAGRR